MHVQDVLNLRGFKYKNVVPFLRLLDEVALLVSQNWLTNFDFSYCL